MVVTGADVGGQFDELVDLFIGQVELLLVVLVMAADATGIGVHDLLHGFFQLFDREETVPFAESGVVFSHFFGEDGLFLGFIEARRIGQALADHVFGGDLPFDQGTGDVFCGQPPATSPAA